MDKLDKMTQDKLNELEKRIREEYAEAALYARDKGKQFEIEMQARISVNQARLDAGEITQDYFNKWLSNQVGRSEGWKRMRDQLATRAMQADKIAAAYINETTPSIYALNANYTAWQIESKAKSIGKNNADFDLVDETIKELIEGKNHISFRVNSINSKADYEWNAEQMQKALTQGILTGQGIKDISDRFLVVMQRDQAAAIRNARTSVTSAQNAGRQHTYEAAEKMGIEILKEWMSAQDDRVRESHAELDGVRVKQDKDFPNGLAYPGDPKGAPGEVYNCRCTMRAVMPKMKGTVTTHNTGKTEQTYREWIIQKQDAVKGEQFKKGETDKRQAIGDFIDYETLNEIVSKAERNNIRMTNFENYRGNPEILNQYLEDTIQAATFCGIKSTIILNYDYIVDRNGNVETYTFAITKGNTITLNRFVYDDFKYLLKAFDETKNLFVKGASYRTIATHEVGHLWQHKNKKLYAKMIDIIDKKAYNEGIDKKTFLGNNISIYSASVDTMGNMREVASEIWTGYKTNHKLCNDILKEVGCI